MILLCDAPDDVVQERRDARGHGHARAVLRDAQSSVARAATRPCRQQAWQREGAARLPSHHQSTRRRGEHAATCATFATKARQQQHGAEPSTAAAGTAAGGAGATPGGMPEGLNPNKS